MQWHCNDSPSNSIAINGVSCESTKTSAHLFRMRPFQKYFFAAILSIICSLIVLQIWHFKWIAIPFNYSGDTFFYSMTIKSLIKTGWYLTNPSLGVPDGYFLADFPISESFHYLILKIISWFSSNWALVFNIFFLLGFPLITISALFVFQRFGLCYPFALTASLLFSVLPFRLIRAQGHAFLTAYYICPLAIWLVVLLYQNRLFDGIANKKNLWFLYSLICIFLASGGVYYAYFVAFFMLLSGVLSSYAKTSFQPLKYSLFFVAIIVITSIANILPTITYQIKHGVNHHAGKRFSVESEVYALKISQLLLPIEGDRLFSKLKKYYNKNSVSSNENSTAALGILGSIGFLILIGKMFIKQEESINNSISDILAKLNLGAILLATMGGFSSLISLLIFSKIRCYNRISVFIAFFSLFAFFNFFQKKIKKPNLLWSLSALFLIIGLFNQTSNKYALPKAMKSIAKAYKNDRAFFQQMEQILPCGSMVFQLPYIAFPEGAAHMDPYAHLTGPLHSNSLRWSFGAIKGRPTDLWQKYASNLEVPEMIREIRKKGFIGLYVDRNGYVDGGQAIETELFRLLKIRPLADSHRSFWDLRDYFKTLNEL